MLKHKTFRYKLKNTIMDFRFTLKLYEFLTQINYKDDNYYVFVN